MFDRVRPGLRGAAIAFAFALLGLAQVSGANDAADYSNVSVATVGSAATSHADLESVADVNSDYLDVIEEIVVVGAKKNRRSKLGRGQSVDPEIKGPSRLDWQFFPVYDPEGAPLHFSHYQIGDQIQRAGFIEVFRIRFGG